MTERQKQIQYRANKLRAKLGISHDEALTRAKAAADEELHRLGETRAKQRKAQQNKRKFKATYTSNDRMPGRVLQGGAPGSGKRS